MRGMHRNEYMALFLVRNCMKGSLIYLQKCRILLYLFYKSFMGINEKVKVF